MSATPILLSAGEASGDMYAARLATAPKERADVEIFGMGGPQMRAAGVETIVDYSEVNVLGITEVLKHLPSLRRALRRLVDEAHRRDVEVQYTSPARIKRLAGNGKQDQGVVADIAAPRMARLSDYLAKRGEAHTTLFLLDGVTNTDYTNGVYVIPPIIDDLQEFKVQSHDDKAEYGGVLGGVVNVVTRSGTNHFHGSGWEFVRNTLSPMRYSPRAAASWPAWFILTALRCGISPGKTTITWRWKRNVLAIGRPDR